MQEIFLLDPENIEKITRSISSARFRRYLALANGDKKNAVLLYLWNIELSCSFYTYIQFWEVSLRNKIEEFFEWKYGRDWYLNDKLVLRTLKKKDQKKFQEAVERQTRSRGDAFISPSAIVADLSAGFWVSQLSTAYNIPYTWRYNLSKIAPFNDGFDRHSFWSACDSVLVIRNRIAHHEPILHLPLVQRHAEVRRLVGAMCGATQALADMKCTFEVTYAAKPIL